MIAGLFAMAGGILLASTASGYGTLLVAQTIAGIGGSTFHPTGMSLISDYETDATEGKAMGVFGFGGALGTMAAPVIVGGVAAIAGWRVALAAAVAVGLAVTGAVVYLFATADDAENASTTDRPRSDGGRRPSGSLRERARAAGLPVDMEITRGIVLLFLATVTLSMQHRAIQTYTTAYVTAETGSSASVGNLAFFALLVGGSLASLYAGDLADRVDRGSLGIAVSLATAVLVASTLGSTVLVDRVPTVPLLVVFAGWFAVTGATMYASYPVKNAMVSEQAERASSGSLFGIIQTGSAIGSAGGPAVFGVLSTRWGVVAAFPAIAVVSLVLASLFAALRAIDE